MCHQPQIWQITFNVPLSTHRASSRIRTCISPDHGVFYLGVYYGCSINVPGRIRARDPQIKSLVLYQLSYRNVKTVQLHLRNGENGIRTHVPKRASGFQDRRVMATSLPLHKSVGSASCALDSCGVCRYHRFSYSVVLSICMQTPHTITARI